MIKVAVALTHGHAAKWLQILLYSLKSLSNNVHFDIFIAKSFPNHPSIKAITENDLGAGVTFIECQRRLYSHAVGLDEILDLIWDKGYQYMFCTETDCRAMKQGWLDWYVDFMQNKGYKSPVGMAGFFWSEGTNHLNINPSATIYDMEMLKKYHAEARANKEGIFYHPKGNKNDTTDGMDSNIKSVVGAFSETRGIKNPSPLQAEMIAAGVPQASWFEPGAWLYYRMLGEYEEARIPCDHVYMKLAQYDTPEGTYYGGKADPYFIHYWGGTRCYDFLKHPVDDHFVRTCAPMWMEREDRIWKEVVPEQYRGIVYDIEKEINLEGMMRKNLLKEG